MVYYYKIVGHAEDQEQMTQTMSFNGEQSNDYISYKFREEWCKSNLDPSSKEPEIYIDFIFKSYQPIQEVKQ